MIISLNNQALQSEFNLLLAHTMQELANNAQQNPATILALNGIKIESYIKDVMTKQALNTSFANSIELIGGYKFPDIIAHKYFGVEVKTSKQNHWQTTGNSIAETTRVTGVERIFLLFAKFCTPIAFKVRPYEDVLSDVVVTHSPRYLIDMNLPANETIFNKLNLSYDQFRSKKDPIKTIIKHYKSTLQEGEELWWMGASEHVQASNLVIRSWNNLGSQETLHLKMSAYAYFPEIFGSSQTKFSRFALWLVTHNSIVCPNVRDLFTAGGKKDLIINGQTYFKVPRIVLNLCANYADVVEIITNTDAVKLANLWQISVNNTNKISVWHDLVSNFAHQISDAKYLNIRHMLENLS